MLFNDFYVEHGYGSRNENRLLCKEVEEGSIVFIVEVIGAFCSIASALLEFMSFLRNKQADYQCKHPEMLERNRNGSCPVTINIDGDNNNVIITTPRELKNLHEKKKRKIKR